MAVQCNQVEKGQAVKTSAVLLINLGTPHSAAPEAVRKYLIEFLTDKRVIDLPWLQRQLLVRFAIVPKRYKQSAKAYQAIWSEQGSPLLHHSLQLKKELQTLLGSSYRVELAMRYQKPSLKSALEGIMNSNVDHLIILPLFPQYASATTGSVYQKTMELIKNSLSLPKITFIDSYADDPGMIEAFAMQASSYDLAAYDHILFSFHGLPQSHLIKGDTQNVCLRNNQCCKNFKNSRCYGSQCYATALALAEKLHLSSEHYTVCFQSRLGKEPWLQPYTSEIISILAKKDKKKILVFCPSFVCDCLETVYEIGVEYKEEFLSLGGERLDLVEGLNSSPYWVKALENLVRACSKTSIGTHLRDWKEIN